MSTHEPRWAIRSYEDGDKALVEIVDPARTNRAYEGFILIQHTFHGGGHFEWVRKYLVTELDAPALPPIVRCAGGIISK